MKKRYFIFKLAMFVFFLGVLPANAGETSEKKFNVYPNPVDRGAVMTIETPDDCGEVTLFLYNAVGKVVQTVKLTTKTTDIDAPILSGIYIMRFVEKQKVISVGKIVVKE